MKVARSTILVVSARLSCDALRACCERDVRVVVSDANVMLALSVRKSRVTVDVQSVCVCGDEEASDVSSPPIGNKGTGCFVCVCTNN